MASNSGESEATTPTFAVGDVVSFDGTSACAKCSHGVVPIGAEETLGFALELNDGRVVVVEDAHQMYPELYASRQSGLNVAVTGQVVQIDDRAIWVAPKSLELVSEASQEPTQADTDVVSDSASL